MPFESINPPQFPTPIAPYSAGAKAGNTVYVSGVLALGEGGVVLHVGNVAAQTRHVLDVIKVTLEAAGATLADVAMNHIFLKDLADYAAFTQTSKQPVAPSQNGPRRKGHGDGSYPATPRTSTADILSSPPFSFAR